MKPHVAVITLGVRDLKQARRFYSEGLEWPIQQEDSNWVCFLLGDGSSALALYPWDELAADAQVPADGTGFRGVTLAYNVRSHERVDEVLAEAERAGGKATAATSLIPMATCGRWPPARRDFLSPSNQVWPHAYDRTASRVSSRSRTRTCSVSKWRKRSGSPAAYEWQSYRPAG